MATRSDDIPEDNSGSEAKRLIFVVVVEPVKAHVQEPTAEGYGLQPGVAGGVAGVLRFKVFPFSIGRMRAARNQEVQPKPLSLKELEAIVEDLDGNEEIDICYIPPDVDNLTDEEDIVHADDEAEIEDDIYHEIPMFPPCKLAKIQDIIWCTTPVDYEKGAVSIEDESVKRYPATGTVRENRMLKCPLESSKSIGKKARGTMDARYHHENDISVVR
ncbi:hypothetical protein ILUMI_24205 [Ignelater luminosus]|uniref:Uncharacterized protein n=1 Tax=Ignelater luminosus TaxID=2038154 RepID=A0A8K0FYY9_IGNLU|nr:hypothetical protein ILUMI_24205 [Ignelater luminosus]